MNLKRLLFYWMTSFVLAVLLYYILWAIMPQHYVFGSLFRMYSYHYEHPLVFIFIPCFFYGIIASLFAKNFSKQSRFKQILLTIGILLLTILISAPFGGMLWHYYDMKAGFFPSNWIMKMIQKGFQDGLKFGWLIIALSIPYNIIGSTICFFLTKKGSELFKKI
ncbi:MAG: hypothetical protein QM535_14025 [Limnohabitans sp.]|nr:hypothetical protein [Limnohabitans sp.]